MATICITGAAGGIGLATRRLLEARGDTVVGVDLRGAEVDADLATDEGRAAMVAGVTERSGGVLDGLVAGAGVQGAAPSLVVSVNYFGAIATLEGLRPLLAAGTNASVVAISSNSATAMQGRRAGHRRRVPGGRRGRRPRRGRGGGTVRRLPVDEAGPGAVGPPPGAGRRLDRRGHPAQRRRPRPHGDGHDRGAGHGGPRPG